VAVRTSRVASVRVMPWEGAVPRSARGPDGEAARRRLARNYIVVPYFERLKLQKIE
jgi:hypothetical protein